MNMVNLLEPDQEEFDSKVWKLSFLAIIIFLFIIDNYFISRDGDYIIIGGSALTVRDLFILLAFAVALVALMRPMEHKKFQKH